MIDTPSPNFGDRRDGATIDMLVLHYTGMPSSAGSLARLCDPISQVSAHYLIDLDGTVHRMVPEEKRAWHAGVSYWRGTRDVNSHSIGIELQNPDSATLFPDPQIDATIALCLEILSRHPIRPAGVVGHSDVAPDRKQDPGALFPWRSMAQSGVGVFPNHGIGTDRPLDSLLTDIGYDPAADQRIAAFQRRFRVHKIDNRADNDCARIAAAYLELLQEPEIA